MKNPVAMEEESFDEDSSLFLEALNISARQHEGSDHKPEEPSSTTETSSATPSGTTEHSLEKNIPPPLMEGLERPEPHGGIVPLMGLEVQSPEARRKAKEEVAEAKETTEKSRGPKKRLQNVFTRMEDAQYGPLSILYRSVEGRLKVKVWTRSFRHVRGICTGYIVAFDKHWNLAMVDVDEIYRVPISRRTAWTVTVSGNTRKGKSEETRPTDEQPTKTGELNKVPVECPLAEEDTADLVQTVSKLKAQLEELDEEEANSNARPLKTQDHSGKAKQQGCAKEKNVLRSSSRSERSPRRRSRSRSPPGRSTSFGTSTKSDRNDRYDQKHRLKSAQRRERSSDQMFSGERPHRRESRPARERSSSRGRDCASRERGRSSHSNGTRNDSPTRRDHSKSRKYQDNRSERDKSRDRDGGTKSNRRQKEKTPDGDTHENERKARDLREKLSSRKDTKPETMMVDLREKLRSRKTGNKNTDAVKDDPLKDEDNNKNTRSKRKDEVNMTTEEKKTGHKEKFVESKVKARISKEPATVTAGSKSILKRHVNQLFIRGDNVVMVSIVDVD